jgi:transmembrane sensor
MNTQERITAEAAAWAVRVEAGLDGAGQDAFLQWLTDDPRHGDEYERQRARWARLDILADWRPEHAETPNRDLLAPAARRIFPWRRRSRAWLPWLSLAGAAAAVAACAVIVLHPARTDAPAAPPRAAAQPVEIAVAREPIPSIEQRKLEDGTVVELNRCSAITVLYSATERLVRLDRGEANFQVAKDTERPFVVDVDGVRVRAVGTSFNVRRGDAAVEVLVTMGTVAVDAPPGVPATGNTDARESTYVEAGQMAVVSLDTRAPELLVEEVAVEKIDTILAWHPQLLDITELPLSDVVEEFNKRNAPICLVIADAELARTVVSATLRSDQVENFVRLLEAGFGVKAERAGNRVTLRKRQRE